MSVVTPPTLPIEDPRGAYDDPPGARGEVYAHAQLSVRVIEHATTRRELEVLFAWEKKIKK